MATPTSTRHPSSSSAGQARRGKRSGLLRGFFALRHSRDGIAAAWREESAFRQEVCGAAVLLPIACLVSVSATERVLLTASVLRSSEMRSMAASMP